MKKSLQEFKKSNPTSKSCTNLYKSEGIPSLKQVEICQDTFPRIESTSTLQEEENPFSLFHKISSQKPKEIICTRNIKIKNLMWVEKSCLFLTEERTLFSSGLDENKTGILGQGEIYELSSPKPIEALADYKIKTYDIWGTHAWATESSGKLFTWGQNFNGELGLKEVKNATKPTCVQIYKAAEVKEARVAKGYTAFKTSGGYLYIIGSLEKSNKSNLIVKKFHQIQGISNYFIRSFICTERFIAILTQTGEILYVDEYYQVSMIHSDTCKKNNWRDDRVESLSVTQDHIISLSRNWLYIWKPVMAKPPIHPTSIKKENKENCKQIKLYFRFEGDPFKWEK